MRWRSLWSSSQRGTSEESGDRWEEDLAHVHAGPWPAVRNRAQQVLRQTGRALRASCITQTEVVSMSAATTSCMLKARGIRISMIESGNPKDSAKAKRINNTIKTNC